MMSQKTRTVTVLGATGSIGDATLDIVRQQQKALGKASVCIKALTAGSNWQKLARLAMEFEPDFVALADVTFEKDLREALSTTGVEVAAGSEAIKEAASLDAKWVMAAITGSADALLLKAQLLYKLGEEKKALRHLKKLVRKYPEARRPRITYIRMLLAAGDTGKAEKQLATMAEQYPEDLDLRFSLALLALEAGATEPARQQLQALLAENYRPDDMHLYLGQAAEQVEEPDQAVDHYLKVQGPQAVRASVQAARLLYQQGSSDQASALMASLAQQHPELGTSLTITEAEMRNNIGDPQGALILLDRAVKTEPDNTELLYSRAMIAEKTGDLGKLETDLQRVLSINPDDASALNALGYTLANRTQRLDEAYSYISRALELRPNDPAILDSMGWVLYKRGEPETAREYLRRAYEKFPDPEVAAHYGEVLWVLGAQNQARQVWRDTLESNPDAPHIREVMEKLGARL
ncbi:MAG: tetratricopeptide repeat protein [Alcanivorax sp.]|nr:tetratricopeptide repeat protein [Alcanivorax sp.]